MSKANMQTLMDNKPLSKIYQELLENPAYREAVRDELVEWALRHMDKQ